MDIKIIKSKTRKRSIQISVDKNRQITVKAPFKTKNSEIENFLNEHKDWIEKTLSKIPVTEKTNYREGELFLFMGKRYPLFFKQGKRNRVTFTNNQFIYFGEIKEEYIKKQFEVFYKKFGKEYCLIKSKEYADLIQKTFNRVSIKDVNTRWGSCSSKNNLNYNYRLFMAPKEVADYVIAHEVCHLKHRDHSKNFWSCVEQIYPNYKQCRKWLKKNGHLLSL